MNLSKLFKIQKQLDERIVKEKGLEGQELLDKKILALQVELGELANEWRGFKFWSEDQEPRTKIKKVCETCGGERYILISESFGFDKCSDCDGKGDFGETNPLLEEYVDCLHFILSIGLELGYTFSSNLKWQSRTTTVQFNGLFHAIATLNESIENECDEDDKRENFDDLVGGFLGLGDMLGFTWEQIEQSYLEKNKINHARQESGY